MPSAHLVRSSPVERTPRVLQLEGMFDIPPSQRSELRWNVRLPIEERPWNVGLVVGPSGSGKTTIARALFGASMLENFDWPSDRAVVDGFPRELGIREITGLLSSVGFSSPRSWLRPFGVLSAGEQFRVTIARALAERSELVVVDEFTSVVDRTVAKIGSAAIAKAVRRRDQRFIALSCHEDVIEWLQPDWMYEPATNAFRWRSVRPRPAIELDVRQVDRRMWEVFRRHHYLDASLSPAARCFVGLVEGRPAVFTAVLHFPHPKRPGWREHRTVCLPDFQGVGIGNRMSDFIAGAHRATGKPYRSVTSHPAMIRYRSRSKHWAMRRRPSLVRRNRMPSLRRASAHARLTASFEYVGPVSSEAARVLN